MMLYCWQKFTNLADLKAYALSVTILAGQPNLDMMFSSMNFMMTVSVAFFAGMASTHFVK